MENKNHWDGARDGEIQHNHHQSYGDNEGQWMMQNENDSYSLSDAEEDYDDTMYASDDSDYNSASDGSMYAADHDEEDYNDNDNLTDDDGGDDVDSEDADEDADPDWGMVDPQETGRHDPMDPSGPGSAV